jgi:hypothetical protein
MLESNFVYGPPEVCERYTLYPATTETLGVQVSETEAGVVVVLPVPERVMLSGEFVALLATATVPGSLPAAVGANVTFNVADCPGVRIKPAETPLVVYGAPEPVTAEIVTLEFPEFVRTTGSKLLCPSVTVPKAKVLVLVVSVAVATVPIPLKETGIAVAERSLTTETVPDRAPAAFGEKTTLKVDWLPAAIVRGSAMPVIVTPAAVVLTCVTERFEPPPFEIVTD